MAVRHDRPDTRDVRECNLQQRAPDHLQRLLSRKPADALAVAGKVAFHDLRSFFAGERDIEQPSKGIKVGTAVNATSTRKIR